MRTIVGGSTIGELKVRVQVEDSGGTWRDVSSRLETITCSDDVDSDAASVDLTFRNNFWAYVNVATNVNLDPLDENSTLNQVSGAYSPLLARYNEIKVEVSKNGGTNWYEVFRGYVGPGSVTVDTNVDGDDVVTVKPVDISFPYKEYYYHDTLVYKDADAVSIMGQMFTDHGFSQTVVEMDAPGLTIDEFPAGQTNLWDAQKKIIEPTGYIYRIRWDSGSSSFKPTVYDPIRTKSSPDWTCDGDFRTRRMDLDESDVRTEVVIIFRERLSGAQKTHVQQNDDARAKYGIPDGKGGRKHKTLWYVTKGFGERYAQVDTMSEAETLGGYVLHDLAEPSPDTEINMPFVHPGVEVHDMIAFVGRDYTINVGVMGYSWTLDVTNKLGEMTIAGTVDRVIGQYRSWTAKDARNVDVANEQRITLMSGDGSRPPRPSTITGRSYWGKDSTTGQPVPITVFETERSAVWDLDYYVWEWWIVGEDQVHREMTRDPILVLKGLQVGKQVQAQVSVVDWSKVGG